MIQETGAKPEKDKDNPQFVEARKGMASQKKKKKTHVLNLLSRAVYFFLRFKGWISTN